MAPEGAVIKIAGLKEDKFEGVAKVYHSEESAFDAVSKREISEGDVVVIRYEGPKGGPGMREMLAVTAAIVGQGLGEKVAMLTDGRFWRNQGIHDRTMFSRSNGRWTNFNNQKWR